MEVYSKFEYYFVNKIDYGEFKKLKARKLKLFGFKISKLQIQVFNVFISFIGWIFQNYFY